MTGETAPLIFTALGSSLFTADPTQPMSSLPLFIYEFIASEAKQSIPPRDCPADGFLKPSM